MHLKRLCDLAASATGRRFRSEAAVNAWLDDHRIIDSEARISVKLELMAAGELATDQGNRVDLATDRSQYQPQTPPVSREMQSWLRKSGLSVERSYSHDEITQALSRSSLDTVEKMAVRAELGDRGLIRAATTVNATSGRTFQASADTRPRGNMLLNADGTPRTLRFT